MGDTQKYYYMRLKDNFFDTNEIVVLESLPDGYLYSNILLKLYLRSLKDNGKLMFNDRIPYNSQMIATITRHQIGTVEKALQIFKEMGLIEVLDTGAIYMSDIQKYIGKSSTEADRQRLYDRKIKEEKLLLESTNKKSCKKSCKKPTPEIEIKLEKELELKKEINKEPKLNNKKAYRLCVEEYTSNEDLRKALMSWVEMRIVDKKPFTHRALELALNKLDTLADNDDTKIRIVNESVERGWLTFYKPKQQEESIEEMMKRYGIE